MLSLADNPALSWSVSHAPTAADIRTDVCGLMLTSPWIYSGPRAGLMVPAVGTVGAWVTLAVRLHSSDGGRVMAPLAGCGGSKSRGGGG